MSDPTNMEEPDVEILEIEIEPAEVADTPDGGAVVTMSEKVIARDEEFFANLASNMPEADLSALAADLVKKIEKDQQAREQRVKQYEEGIQRTGLGNDAPGGAQFPGASKAVHPIITESCIDFSARIMKEMMPFDGPVKDKVIGETTDEKVQKAKRKTRFMNWQITEQMPEFRAEFEQMETQVPLGGSQYFTLYFDKKLRRPVPKFVAIDDVLLPFATANFYSSHRKTHVLHLTEMEYDDRISSGMYRDLNLIPESQPPEETAAAQATNKIEGRTSNEENIDGLRDVYECYAFLQLDGDEETLPYIVSIDKASERILSIYRNFQPDDDTKAAIDHLFEFDFIRWRGAYGVGIPHIAGGLAGAITGALRALLDSALINNMPTAFKLKGGSRGGETLSPQPTEVIEVDGQLSPDQDIRKTMMPVPFNPPSPVLFQLLGFLTEAAKGVVRTSLDNEAMDTNVNTPVGTQLSRVEQGLVVFGGIFMRQYTSMNRVLKRLHEINRDYLPEMRLPQLEDEMMVEPNDFQGPMDVVPVANPTIYSEQQRLSQFTALQQRAAMLPQLYKLPEIERSFVKDVLKIPNGDKFLNIPPEPERRTAAAENVAMMVGNEQVEVYPDQDDLAHIQAHVQFFQSPVLGGNPIAAMKALPALLPHLLKHQAALYTKGVEQMKPVIELQLRQAHETSRATGVNPGPVPTADQIEALASLHVEQTLQKNPIIAMAQPIMAQMGQALQSMQPQDPARIEAQKAQAEAQAKAQEMQSKAQEAQSNLLVAQKELEITQQKNMSEAAIKEKQLMLDNQAMLLEQERLAREEAAEERQREREWHETQLRILNETRQLEVEERKQVLAEMQMQFEQTITQEKTLFEQRLAALQLKLDDAKQRLDEFVAGQAAAMDREQAQQDRIALAHTVASSVAEAAKVPKQRTVKFKRGADGSIESGEIHEGEG